MKGLVGLLLTVGALMVYWQWVLGVLVLVAAAFLLPIVVRQVYEEHTARVRRRARLAARADRQHRRTTGDDPRGTFGDYPPAQL